MLPLKKLHPIMYKSVMGISQPSSKVNKLTPMQNAYVRKRGITQPKIYNICSKVNQLIYTLVETFMTTKRILAYADSGSSDILLTSLFLYQMSMSKQEGQDALNCSPEYTGQKSNV